MLLHFYVGPSKNELEYIHLITRCKNKIKLLFTKSLHIKDMQHIYNIHKYTYNTYQSRTNTHINPCKEIQLIDSKSCK